MHQKFIPLKNILNMANSSIKYDLTLAINAEYSDSHIFNPFEFQKSEQWINLKEKDIHRKIEICPSPWISLSDEGEYTYNSMSVLANNAELGCQYLFSQIIVDPNRNIIACCGLASERINEMKLGNIKQTKILEAWETEINDILKKWLFISGSQKILKTLINMDKELEIAILDQFNKSIHQCQFCNILHNNIKAKETLEKYLPIYKKQIEEVFNDKLELIKFTQS